MSQAIKKANKPVAEFAVVKPANDNVSSQPSRNLQAANDNPGPQTRYTQPQYTYSQTSKYPNKKVIKKIASAPLKVVSHTKAVSVTGSLYTPALWVWFWVQFISAILSLISLGAASAAADSLVVGVVDFFSSALFNFSVTEGATFMFLTFWWITLITGVGTLIAFATAYKAAFLHPFDGQGSDWKGITFAVAVLGYTVPGLNLFPWFTLYTATVIANPK